ncbi:sulfurtransferase [Svornostia abyssi]|uniref:Sulfurtransferase n=1 Tax=Svornostia abyssi TaxID=2898438 RepID=A0ABY5PLG2_9ACTN|nr:sulfurtransferase [Parviterribacteraceae bacterium J379]
MAVLITAAELRTSLPDVTLLDVRWSLAGPPGRDDYRAGHIPGAVFVDLDTELAAPPSAAEGRHPLPDPADLQTAARRWGVREGRPVVVYDATANLAAARAWWLLRWAGIADVRLLDGGLAAWDGELATGDEHAAPGDVMLRPGALPTLEIDDVAAFARNATLLDARAAERFRGSVEPVDPRAGHIPGAVSAPTSENVDDAGRFLPADELRARFEALGAGERVGVYCGSGVNATHEIAALEIAGYDAALYPGSWSQWSNRADLPAATGE